MTKKEIFYNCLVLEVNTGEFCTLTADFLGVMGIGASLAESVVSFQRQMKSQLRYENPDPMPFECQYGAVEKQWRHLYCEGRVVMNERTHVMERVDPKLFTVVDVNEVRVPYEESDFGVVGDDQV